MPEFKSTAAPISRTGNSILRIWPFSRNLPVPFPLNLGLKEESICFPDSLLELTAGRIVCRFPTREETILPENMTKDFRTAMEQKGPSYHFSYRGSDGIVEYVVSTAQPFFRDIEVLLDGKRVGRAWSGAGVEFGEEPRRIELLGSKKRR